MSPLLSFSKDKSIWRYEKEMKCKWKRFRWPAPFGIHRYAVMNIDGHEFEIDAVYQQTLGPMRHTASAVCHLDSALVGITRATVSGHGSGNSNFTYVEVGNKLLGVSSPGLSLYGKGEKMSEPKVQLWSRTTVHSGIGHAKEPIAVEEGKVPGKDGTWQNRVQAGSPLKGRLLGSDGSLAAGLRGGNPRDIRLQKLGLPDSGRGKNNPPLPPMGNAPASYEDFLRYHDEKRRTDRASSDSVNENEKSHQE